MNKTIVCLWSPGNLGKTSTIRCLFEKLADLDGDGLLHESGNDICAAVKYKGITLGIASQGDPNSLQDEWLRELVSRSCDIILCASRSKGSTVDTVRKYATENGYGIIWFCKPYLIVSYTKPECDEMYSMLNQTAADSVLALIDNLINK